MIDRVPRIRRPRRRSTVTAWLDEVDVDAACDRARAAGLPDEGLDALLANMGILWDRSASWTCERRVTVGLPPCGECERCDPLLLVRDLLRP